jgi:hypothetical protein
MEITMRYKSIIVVLMLLSVRVAAIGQADFDSIRICHDKDGALKHITIGEYQVTIDQGKLISFNTKDQLVNYDEARRIMLLKEPGMKPDEFISFQPASNGIIVSTKDKAVTVSSLSALLPGFPGTQADTTILMKIGRIQVPVSFKFNRPYKIDFPFANKYLTMLFGQNEQRHSWDFSLETYPDSSSVVYTTVHNKPYYLTIQDNKTELGVSLNATKKNGVYNKLSGLRKYKPESYGSDNEYILDYTSKGMLKKNRSKFKLDCKL